MTRKAAKTAATPKPKPDARKPKAMDDKAKGKLADMIGAAIAAQPETTARKPSLPAPAPTKSHAVVIPIPSNGKPRAQQLAEGALEPPLQGALVTVNFLTPSGVATPGDENFLALVEAVSQRVRKAAEGDSTDLKVMLATNAITLNAMFGEFGRRAAINMGTHLPAAESYTRMALRAQAQCRDAIETLHEMNHPRPVFINGKQVNVSNGSQQVNNTEGPQQVNNGAAALPAPGPQGAPALTDQSDAETATAILDFSKAKAAVAS